MPVICPHCRTPIEGVSAPWPPEPARCASCRLVIGAGRGVEAMGEDPLARSHASAAGTLAARARRDVAGAAEAENVPLERIAEDIRAVAAEVGSTIGRLRMLDYERVAQERGHVPLAGVIARHGSWKAARAAAAEGRDESRESSSRPTAQTPDP